MWLVLPEVTCQKEHLTAVQMEDFLWEGQLASPSMTKASSALPTRPMALLQQFPSDKPPSVYGQLAVHFKEALGPDPAACRFAIVASSPLRQ